MIINHVVFFLLWMNTLSTLVLIRWMRAFCYLKILICINGIMNMEFPAVTTKGQWTLVMILKTQDRRRLQSLCRKSKLHSLPWRRINSASSERLYTQSKKRLALLWSLLCFRSCPLYNFFRGDTTLEEGGIFATTQKQLQLSIFLFCFAWPQSYLSSPCCCVGFRQ